MQNNKVKLSCYSWCAALWLIAYLACAKPWFEAPHGWEINLGHTNPQKNRISKLFTFFVSSYYTYSSRIKRKIHLRIIWIIFSKKSDQKNYIDWGKYPNLSGPRSMYLRNKNSKPTSKAKINIIMTSENGTWKLEGKKTLKSICKIQVICQVRIKLMILIPVTFETAY